MAMQFHKTDYIPFHLSAFTHSLFPLVINYSWSLLIPLLSSPTWPQTAVEGTFWSNSEEMYRGSIEQTIG